MIFNDILCIMDDLLQRLDDYRLEKRITQKELAKMLGVAFVTVSRWLNGHCSPNRIQTYHIKKLLSDGGKKK
jgi:transcriptional regulator with XRE-family HTH domain